MGVFERILQVHQRLRHQQILASVPRLRPPDVSVGVEGFLPPREAAEVMGVTVPELAWLVDRGLLEAEDVGERELWVRPAIVSVLAVDDKGDRRVG